MSDPSSFFEPQETADPKPSYELYIKASTIDGETKGSCPLCQQWFMISYVLAQHNDVKFRVFTVNAAMPPKNFMLKLQGKNPSQYPVVIGLSGEDQNGQNLENKVHDSLDEVEAFFDVINETCPLLKRNQQKNLVALGVVDDLTKKFNLFLQNEWDDGTKLTAYLKKIDEHLEAEDGKYLCGNTISYADCYLMPRLHHVIVAGLKYKKYNIPEDLTHLMDYIEAMYATRAFTETMPSDQDIVSHYQGKAKVNLKPTLEKTTYTTSVPRSKKDSKSTPENGDNSYEGASMSSEDAPNGD